MIKQMKVKYYRGQVNKAYTRFTKAKESNAPANEVVALRQAYRDAVSKYKTVI